MNTAAGLLRKTLRILFAILAALAGLVAGGPRGEAAAITWIGGSANWDASNANWNPADEPDPDDEAIFNTSNTVNMALASNTIQALTLSGGITLNTNGNDLTVDGLVLAGANGTLTIGGSTSAVTADSVAIDNGGTVFLTGGTLTVVEETGSGTLVANPGGTLSGHGVINLNDSVAAGTVLMRLNGGTLHATSTATAGEAATLTINVVDSDGRVDLDNLSASIVISRNDTLAIHGTAHTSADPYSGTLFLLEGATLEMSVAWQTDSAIINVDTGGTAATIAGAAFTFAGATIDLGDLDTLRLSAPFTATAGTIANAGHVIFEADADIGAGVDFQMTGASASLTVNGGYVQIEDADFNADGSGTATNVITVADDGFLDLRLGAGADESLSGHLQLDGGALFMDTADHAWTMNGTVNVGTDTGRSLITFAEVTFTSASVTVGANAELVINAPSVWSTGGNLVVNAGASAEISLGYTALFSNAGTFTGAGELQIAGNATFATPTTIDMPGGTVALDGGDILGNTVAIDADVTINAGTMISVGNADIGTDTLEIAPLADLTVNLTDPAAEWTINSTAVVNITGAGGTSIGGGIAGSDFNLNGTVNITGNALFTARCNIAGTVNIAAASSLNLQGGALNDLNRFLGGMIAGSGALRARNDEYLVDEGLVGFGTIAPGIEFAGTARLLADDGILTITGPIVDVGRLGTADGDGILNVTTAWNTDVTSEVNLSGGELRGATITNAGAGGIRGYGLLSARVINDTVIAAAGDPLVVETAGDSNDWDGASEAGRLEGSSDNLEIRDNAGFLFDGEVVARFDREVFANGFELQFAPGSSLVLAGGAFRSTASTDFGGTMDVLVPAGGDSALRIAGTWTFQSTSTTILKGDLRLENTLTVVQVGAFFTAGGALINPAGRALRLLDGILSADLNVLVLNEGTLALGNPATDAQVQGEDFQQTATGALGIDLGGTALNAFDRLNLTGASALSGALNLSLIGGYIPAHGHTFQIITATSGITGAFTSVTQPAGMPGGLAFSVGYSPFTVTLSVLTAYEAWANSFGLTDPADKTPDANPDHDVLNNLGEFALDGNPANGNSTGRVVMKIAPVGGVRTLTLTLPVRVGTIADPADPPGGPLVLLQAAESLRYSIQSSDALAAWTLTVTEVLGADATAIQAGLPALAAGWVYRTFRSPGAVAGDPAEFMRVVVSD